MASAGAAFGDCRQMFKNVGAWRAAVLLSIAGLGSGLPMSVMAPGMERMAPALAAGDKGMFLAQLAVTIPGLAMFLAAPIIGRAAERVGYRHMLLLGLVGFIAMGMAGFVIASASLLLASRFLLGVFAVTMLTPTYALVSYYFDDRDRDRLLGYITGASAAAAVIVAILAGAIVRYLDWHWSFLLFAIAIPSLLLAILVITDRGGARTAIRPPPTRAGEKAPMSAMIGILLFVLWTSMISYNPIVQLPFLLTERGEIDPQLVSTIISVLSISMIVVSPFYERFAIKFSTNSLIAIVFGLFAVAHLLIGAMDSVSATFVATVIIGVATVFILPVAASYVFKKLPAGAHGRAMSSLVGCLFVVQFINPFVLQPVHAVLGMARGFVLIGVLNAVGACVTLAAGSLCGSVVKA